MKKVITVGLFAFLAVIGYYIGNAVAQGKNNSNSQEPVGVMVIEEEYDVVAPVSAESAAQHKESAKKMMQQKHHNNSSNQHNSSDGVMMEETISETETAN